MKELPRSYRAEFQALSLLRQHRHLLVSLEEIEEEVSRLREPQHNCASPPCEDWWLLLGDLVGTFSEHLATHFDAESASTSALLREQMSPDRARALESLDREHPELLRRFHDLAERLEIGQVDRSTALLEVEFAIFSFRDHEAREDTLFFEE